MSTNPGSSGDGTAGNANPGLNTSVNAGVPGAAATGSNRFTSQQHAPTAGVAGTGNQATTSPSTTTPNNQNLNQIVCCSQLSFTLFRVARYLGGPGFSDAYILPFKALSGWMFLQQPSIIHPTSPSLIHQSLPTQSGGESQKLCDKAFISYLAQGSSPAARLGPTYSSLIY